MSVHLISGQIRSDKVSKLLYITVFVYCNFRKSYWRIFTPVSVSTVFNFSDCTLIAPVGKILYTNNGRISCRCSVSVTYFIKNAL